MSRNFELWLEFEEWADADPARDSFFNMRVSLADGRTYALNVWLMDRVASIIHESDEGDDELDKAFSLPPDLLVQRMDRELLGRIVARLLERDQLRREWLVDSAEA